MQVVVHRTQHLSVVSRALRPVAAQPCRAHILWRDAMAKKSRRHQQHSSSFGLENLEGRALLSASLFPKATVGHNWRAQHARPTYRAAHLNGVQPLASAGASGLTPAQMRHAYGVGLIKFNGVNGNGTRPTIATVDAYDDPTATT